MSECPPVDEGDVAERSGRSLSAVIATSAAFGVTGRSPTRIS